MFSFIYSKKAFTIIELMVVVAVIVVLSLILVPKFNGYIKRAQISNEIQIFANAQKNIQNTFTNSFKIYTIDGVENDSWDAETSTMSLPSMDNSTFAALMPDALAGNKNPYVGMMQIDGEKRAIVHLSENPDATILNNILLNQNNPYVNSLAIVIFKETATGPSVQLYKQIKNSTVCQSDEYKSATNSHFSYLPEDPATHTCGLLGETILISKD